MTFCADFKLVLSLFIGGSKDIHREFELTRSVPIPIIDTFFNGIDAHMHKLHYWHGGWVENSRREIVVKQPHAI